MSLMNTTAARMLFFTGAASSYVYSELKDKQWNKTAPLAALTVGAGAVLLTQLALEGKVSPLRAFPDLLKFELPLGILFTAIYRSQTSIASQVGKGIEKLGAVVDYATAQTARTMTKDQMQRNVYEKQKNDQILRDAAMLTPEQKGHFAKRDFAKLDPQVLLGTFLGKVHLARTTPDAIINALPKINQTLNNIGKRPLKNHFWMNNMGKKVERAPVQQGAKWVDAEHGRKKAPEQYEPTEAKTLVTREASILRAPAIPADYDAAFDGQKYAKLAETQYYADPERPADTGAEADPRHKAKIGETEVDHPYYNERNSVPLAQLTNIDGTPYLLDEQGYPLNPNGPTGMKGRVAGYWGENRAVDIIGTTVKHGRICLISGKKDGKDCLIGGMTPKAFKPSIQNPEQRKIAERAEAWKQASKELGEEALGKAQKTPEGKAIYENNKRVRNQALQRETSRFMIYEGDSGDDRSTDNSWYVTTAYTFVFTKDEGEQIKPIGGDDVLEANWTDALDLVKKNNMICDHNRILLASLINPDVQKKLLEEYPDDAPALMDQFAEAARLAVTFGIATAA